MDKEEGPGLSPKEPRHKRQVELIIELSGLAGAVILSLLCQTADPGRQVAMGTV